MIAAIKGFVFETFVKPFALNEVRHLATFVSGIILTYLLAHGAQQSDAAKMAEGAASILIGGAGYAFSEINQWKTRTMQQALSAAAPQTVTLKDGRMLTIGEASPGGMTVAQEDDETAALNRPQPNL
jgi:hypothetical protein